MGDDVRAPCFDLSYELNLSAAKFAASEFSQWSLLKEMASNDLMCWSEGWYQKGLKLNLKC